MPETKRVAEEANRMGQEAQEQAKRVGQEFQRAAERGFEAASRSFAESTEISRLLLPR
jgi:DNA anti-recombination protein RmuC